MTRPLTCADRLPEQGDVIVHESEWGQRINERWWRVWKIALIAGHDWWCLEEMRSLPHDTAITYPPHLDEYLYKKRADGGPVYWPIDAGEFLE